MPDLAQLNLKIDSTSVKRSARDLGKFGKASGAAERAVRRLELAAIAAITALAGVGIKAVAAFAKFEQTAVGIEALIGNAEKAREVIEGIKELSSVSIFDVDDLARNVSILAALGEETDNLIPQLRTLADAAAAFGGSQATETLRRLILNFAEIRAQGRIDAEDIRRLTESRIPILRFLQEATGIAVKDIRKLAEQGKLLADDVLPVIFEALKRETGGFVEKLSATTRGQFQVLMNNVKLALIDIGGTLAQEFDILTLLESAIVKTREWARVTREVVAVLINGRDAVGEISGSAQEVLRVLGILKSALIALVAIRIGTGVLSLFAAGPAGLGSLAAVGVVVLIDQVHQLTDALEELNEAEARRDRPLSRRESEIEFSQAATALDDVDAFLKLVPEGLSVIRDDLEGLKVAINAAFDPDNLSLKRYDEFARELELIKTRFAAAGGLTVSEEGALGGADATSLGSALAAEKRQRVADKVRAARQNEIDELRALMADSVRIAKDGARELEQAGLSSLDKRLLDHMAHFEDLRDEFTTSEFALQQIAQAERDTLNAIFREADAERLAQENEAAKQSQALLGALAARRSLVGASPEDREALALVLEYSRALKGTSMSADEAAAALARFTEEVRDVQALESATSAKKELGELLEGMRLEQELLFLTSEGRERAIRLREGELLIMEAFGEGTAEAAAAMAELREEIDNLGQLEELANFLNNLETGVRDAFVDGLWQALNDEDWQKGLSLALMDIARDAFKEGAQAGLNALAGEDDRGNQRSFVSALIRTVGNIITGGGGDDATGSNEGTMEEGVSAAADSKSLVLINVIDEGTANAVQSKVSSAGHESATMRGNGQPGVTAGRIRAGRGRR